MTRARGRALQQLHELARCYGVETSYHDVVAHRQRRVSPEVLLAVLRSLGAPLETPEQVPAALAHYRSSLAQRVLEPVVVTWAGERPTVELQLPPEWAERMIACTLELESGEAQRWTCSLARLPRSRAAPGRRARPLAKKLSLPNHLPLGVHRLTLETPVGALPTSVIRAPRRAFTPLGTAAGETWGVFLPTYSLGTQKSWGAGDFSDLGKLLDWIQGLGGTVVATLPLLAAFLEEPFEPSPYSPASRLFWNEFYLDMAAIPEVRESRAAQELMASRRFRQELEAVRASSLVDYRRVMAVKRKVLTEVAESFFAQKSGRQAAFKRFCQENPRLHDYARFRAVGELRRTAWPDWPARLRDGDLEPGDYAEEAHRYHLYVQWLTEEQLTGFSRKARERGPGLYLDLPLGVHPASYDVWREREAFATGVAGGAPPDPVFTKGQNWSFPPLHPERIREQGYRYFIACLGHQLRHAGLLRIDHIMALHRLFWIPLESPPGEGAYVRYHAEELYALLCLESHRHRSLIVGENLGSVPPYVNPTMARHNILKMHLVQYELESNIRTALRRIENDSLGGFNTHDMFPFAAWLEGRDIDDRLALHLLNKRGARREQKKRRAMKNALVALLRRGGWLGKGASGLGEIFRACTSYFGASRARAVILNLEDTWLEMEPQNVPGTTEERPNWRRRARYALEEFCQMPDVLDTLDELDRRRKKRKGVEKWRKSAKSAVRSKLRVNRRS